MARLGWLCLSLLVVVAWMPQARASGDFQCEPDWTLTHTALSGCDDMAMLAPGNDTRTNLFLLLLDQRQAEPVPVESPVDPMFDWRSLRDAYYPRPDADDGAYAEGEGSRCRSNAAGASAFIAALNASKVPQDERRLLIEARTALQPDCATTGAAGAAAVSAALAKIASRDGQAFGTYLAGSAAFYDADYDKARAQFAGLTGARDRWVRETALYMLGRVEVNRAQVDAYDEYGWRKQDFKVDPAIIAAADKGLRAYLKAYPAGTYAASARGLLRRVYWLAGDSASLSAEYAALFRRPLPGLDDGRLAEEVDDKLLSSLDPAGVTDPLLLAVYDLQHMRKARDEYSGAPEGSPLPQAALDAQQSAFAATPALFSYLRAARAWYVEGDGVAVLRLIPDAARQPRFSAIEFSRQMLRGIALEARKDRNARGFWMEMLPGARDPRQRAAIELAIALHDERAGALDAVFAADSPVKTPSIREILLANVAGPDLLRRQAKDSAVSQHERDLALFVLLYKSVSRGRYADFLKDQALVRPGASTDAVYWSVREAEKPPVGLFVHPDDLGAYDCPPLGATASALAVDPGNDKARLCLADFMRVNGFDQTSLDTQPPADQLGGTKSLFPGTPYSRLEVYKDIIADSKAGAPDRAYALYRAIRCYAPSGNNSCGGVDVPVATRKGWFQTLKSRYPKSKWASELRFYW